MPSLEGSPPLTDECLAIAANDGHLYLHYPRSSRQSRLSWSLRELSHAVWLSGETSDRQRHFWPTWSPRGDRLACLAQVGNQKQEEGTAVLVYDARGQVRSWEVWSNTHNVPVYLAWCPDNEHLSFVVPQREALSLMLARVDAPGEAQSLVTGIPLFHQYHPGGRFLAVHLGGRFNGAPGRRLYRLALATPDRRLPLSESPGDFGTPAWSPDGRFLAYTAQEDQEQAVTLIEHVRSPALRLGNFPGTGVLQWTPGSESILASLSPSGDQTHFSAVWRFGLDADGPEVLFEQDLHGVEALPEDRWLLFTPDFQQRSVTIQVREPDGSTRLRTRFCPTQPQGFIYQFYHQYRLSHAQLSSDRRLLTFSGYLSRAQLEDDHTPPQVFVLDLDSEAPPEPVGGGTLATWSPVRQGIPGPLNL